MDTSPFLSVTQIALVPVVMALVAMIKGAGLAGSTNRFAPLESVGLGVLGALLVPSETIQLTIIAGVTIGLLAAGVYSGVKATVQS